MWEFSLALENAGTQAELDALAEQLTDLLSGPMAEGLVNLLMFGAAKGIPKLAGKQPGWMIQQTPNGPTPISTQHGPPSHVPGQITWGGPADPVVGRPPRRGTNGDIPLPNLPVTLQGSQNTCVPCSLDMLLNELVPNRPMTDLEFFGLGPFGMSGSFMVGFVEANLAANGFTMIRGSLQSE